MLRRLLTVSLAWAILLASLPCGAQKIGLGISGGGAQSFANIGVLRAFDDAGLRIDVIAGSGIGAFIAALYATGRTPDEIEVHATRLGRALAVANAPPGEYASDSEVMRLLVELFGQYDLSGIGRWEQFDPVLTISGMDLRTGENVVFDRGSLIFAVRASLSSSSTLEPIEGEGLRISESRGPLIHALRSNRVDSIVYVQTGRRFPSAAELEGMEPKVRDLEVLSALYAEAGTPGRELISLTTRDVVIVPELVGATPYDYHRVADFARTGYVEAKGKLPHLLKLAGRTGDRPRKRASPKTVDGASRWTLSEIRVDGNHFVPRGVVLRELPLRIGESFTIADLLAAADAVRRTGYFKSIRLQPAKSDQYVILNVGVTEGSAKLPKEAAKTVLETLRDGNVLKRRQAAVALGAIAEELNRDESARSFLGSALGGSDVTTLLSGALNDTDPGVRRAAVASVSKIPAVGRDHLNLLAGRVRSDPDPTVRREAAMGAARISIAITESATDGEIASTELAFQAAKAEPEATEAIGVLQLASMRMRETAALKRVGRTAPQIVFDDTLPLDLQNATEVQVNGVAMRFEMDAASKSIRFLGDQSSFGALRPGLNIIGAGRYWLEERRLRPFAKPYSRSHALVVAIDDYARIRDKAKRGPTGYEPLTTMVNGAGKLVQVLIRLGFAEQNIHTLYNEAATSDAIESSLREFWTGGRFAGADRLFVYFGGHGDIHNGDPLFVTYNFDRARPTSTSFLLNDIAGRQASTLQPHHVLFAVDACHAGMSTRLGDSGLADESRMREFTRLSALRRDTEAKARNILVAGTGEQRALYKNGGLFTSALVAGLDGSADLNKDGVIQFEELLFVVRNRVTAEAAATGVRQDPDGRVLDVHGSGRIVFVRE